MKAESRAPRPRVRHRPHSRRPPQTPPARVSVSHLRQSYHNHENVSTSPPAPRSFPRGSASDPGAGSTRAGPFRRHTAPSPNPTLSPPPSAPLWRRSIAPLPKLQPRSAHADCHRSQPQPGAPKNKRTA